jgi:hypothetical protein
LPCPVFAPLIFSVPFLPVHCNQKSGRGKQRPYKKHVPAHAGISPFTIHHSPFTIHAMFPVHAGTIGKKIGIHIFRYTFPLSFYLDLPDSLY